MRHDLPLGELFPDDDLAPVTAESVRYIYQLRRVNQIVIGLQGLDASLGEKIDVAAGLLGPVNSSLAKTLRALEENATELAARCAKHDELIGTVRALEARLPDPKQVRHEILSDLWLAFEGRVLDNAKEVEEMLAASARQAAATIIKASTLGCLAPVRPADGSTLRNRLIFLWDSASFRVRKFAADWLTVTQLIGVALLALLVAALIFHQPL